MANLEIARELAVREAISYLGDAEIVGIGTGSTIERLINLIKDLRELRSRYFLASSIDTALKLRSLGFRVLDITSVDGVDVYVDSADRVDANLNMIKGGGAALTLEKLLAFNSRLNVFVVDYSKLVRRFTSEDYVPIDVLPQAVSMLVRYIAGLGYECSVRRSAKGKYGPVVSDVGGVLVDVRLRDDVDLAAFNSTIKSLPGVVETGLFIGLSDIVVVGYEDRVEVLRGSTRRGSLPRSAPPRGPA